MIIKNLFLPCTVTVIQVVLKSALLISFFKSSCSIWIQILSPFNVTEKDSPFQREEPFNSSFQLQSHLLYNLSCKKKSNVSWRLPGPLGWLLPSQEIICDSFCNGFSMAKAIDRIFSNAEYAFNFFFFFLAKFNDTKVTFF